MLSGRTINTRQGESREGNSSKMKPCLLHYRTNCPVCTGKPDNEKVTFKNTMKCLAHQKNNCQVCYPTREAVTLIQLPTFEIVVDGEKLPGTYTVESEWEGFVKLSSQTPINSIIVRVPRKPPGNHYDLIPKIFGGNRDANKPLEITCEGV